MSFKSPNSSIVVCFVEQCQAIGDLTLPLQGSILGAGLETQVTLLGYRLALPDWQLLATLAHTLPMR